MKSNSLSFSINLGLVLTFVFTSISKAQIIPDNSLSNNSVVTPNGNILQIEGGTTRGSNLFHSFEQFSVPAEITASFQNGISIQNIFSRITGDSISNIQGILESQGNANLFLMNPNGIIFGENASLNVGGSFLATTADSIHFADGTVFSTNINNSQPLLTVTAPVGLGLGKKTGKIINRSIADDFTGLFIQPSNTITLLGGEIEFISGAITAEEARVEIGAVASENFVALALDEFGWKPEYQGIEDFKDINFIQSSFIFSFGDFGGDIKVQGKNITLKEGSQLILDVFGSTTGNLIVKASDSVVLSGTDGEFISALFNDVQDTATGKGKTLTIETKKLIVENGAQISAGNFGEKESVNVQIKASEFIRIENSGIEGDNIQPSGIFSRVNFGATGSGGDVDIETKELIINQGGQISVSTFGQGNAGNLNIVSSENLEIIGQDTETNNPSGLFAQVFGNGTGDGGTIKIETAQLSVVDGAQISAAARNSGQGGGLIINVLDTILLSGTGDLGRSIDSSGLFVSVEPALTNDVGNLLPTTGDAGSIQLTAKELIVEKGAQISADTFSLGDVRNVNLDVSQLVVRDGGTIGAGSLVLEDAVSNERGNGGILTINATESVEVIGSGKVGNTKVNSSIFTRAEGTGKAGNLNIVTPQLTVADKGSIDVSATGTGEAGSLFISSQDITLDKGSLTAETRTGDQGNITLDDANLLLLGNNSDITTNALEDATGGNITINADLIVALDNSDITANAVRGRGGNIQITTQGIFNSPDSQITASSELGIDGDILIQTPEVDPTSGLLELPSVPIDVAALFAKDLCKVVDDKIASGSSFVITGKGGITPTAEDPLFNSDRIVNWVDNTNTINQTIQQPISGNHTSKKTEGFRQTKTSRDGSVIIESRQILDQKKEKRDLVIQQAQGFLIAADGSLWLTTNSEQVTLQNSGIDHPSCQLN